MSTPPAPRPIAAWMRVLHAVVALAAMGCVAAMFLSADRAELLARAARVGAGTWAAGVTGLVLGHAARAARLWFEWQPRLGHAPFGLCLRVSLLHNAAVLALPWRTGELAYALLLRRAWGVGLADATASLVWLRLQDACVLVGLTLLWLMPSAAAAATLGAALAAVVATAPVLARRARQARPPADPTRGGAVPQRLRDILQAHRGGLPAWGCCVATWGFKMTGVALVLGALTGQPLPTALGGVLAGEWAAVLPLHTPASVGPYEAAVASALTWASPPGTAPLSTWVACALVAHLLSVAVAMLGGGVAALMPPSALAAGSAPGVRT